VYRRDEVVSAITKFHQRLHRDITDMKKPFSIPPLNDSVSGRTGAREGTPKDDEGARTPPAHEPAEYFGDVLRQRIDRRGFVKGAGAVGASLVLAPALLKLDKAIAKEAPGSHAISEPVRFTPIKPSSADQVVVPEGYAHSVILRWGDPLFPDAPAFDLHQQTEARQAQQFGYNCDFLGFFVLPGFLRWEASRFGRLSSRTLRWFASLYQHFSRLPSRRAILVVNHEYTTGGDMFPGYDPDNPTKDQVETEIAAHGASIVEVLSQPDGSWTFVKDSPFNRRITGNSEIEITGPLAGHSLLQTSRDPGGTRVHGMLNNCAGGKTPWGTVLSCEENFDQYFGNFAALKTADPDKAALYQRLRPENGETDRKWERFDTRFDVALEPNEYARFGYVIEIDPYDASFAPKKRTALGRFKHEGAVPVITRDGRVALYSGDDERFQYIYKFISQGTFDPWDRARNLSLLDAGTLYAARFKSDGTGEWLPLLHGEGPLTSANGFASQAKVLIDTRGAAERLGATKMDRPEDVEISPKTGKVYVTLTNNTSRTEASGDPGEDAVNPRRPNPHGHVIEIEETAGDHGALTFRWEIFMLCGDPSNPDHQTFFAGFDPSQVSPIANPDNLLFDDAGNLWIATDGQPKVKDFGWNDGVFAVPTEGPERGFLRQFLSAVPGAEVCGPEFSGDNRSFFCNIQHPGEEGGLPNKTSAWPDGNNPPKPALIAVYHLQGHKIGR
jgi:secreted PhoX family phosphatase